MKLWKKKIDDELTFEYHLHFSKWSLELARYREGMSDDRRNSATVIAFSLTKHWYWGADHSWYDGPWCFFSIGFLHILRQTHNCEKCYKNDHE